MSLSALDRRDCHCFAIQATNNVTIVTDRYPSTAPAAITLKEMPQHLALQSLAAALARDAF